MPITIAVPDYRALFEHIKRPSLRSKIIDHDFGESTLPIEWIILSTQSDGRSYTLEAYINCEGDVGDVLAQVGSALEGKYLFGPSFTDSLTVHSPRFSKMSSDKRLLHAIFDNDDDIQVLNMYNTLYVLAGVGLSPFIDQRPLQGMGRFREDFEFFRDVTQTAINAIYRNFGAGQVPDYALAVRISPPEEKAAVEGKGTKAERQESLERMLSRMMGIGSERFQTLTAEKPELDFDQIIGNERAKEELKALAGGVSDPASYAKWGADLPKGILLYGPPGTAKTTLAKATAYHAKAAFYAPSLTELLSKWYSESEHHVQELFDKARRTKPSIIFLDEIDVIGSGRDEAHEASKRVLSVILTNMEGIKPNDGVVVIGATNRPHVLDEALIRPGRFDYLIEVFLPTPGELAQIFVVHQRLKEAEVRRQLFDPSIDYSQIAQQLPGASGADAREIVRRVLQEQARAEKRGEQVGLVGLEQILRIVQAYERKPVKYERPPLGFLPPRTDNR